MTLPNDTQEKRIQEEGDDVDQNMFLDQAVSSSGANDLGYFALSGDLAKAIQLANLGLQQGDGDNDLGSAAALYQQLQ